MSREPAPVSKPAPPEGIEVCELEVAGETLLVLSFPIPPQDSFEGASLSRSEADVARLAAEGLSNADIAARRGTSVRTVANQIASIFRKLGVSSRRELATRGADARPVKERRRVR